MTRLLLLCWLLGFITVDVSAADANQSGFVWDSPIPADCPFPRSQTLTGILFTGRHSDYQCGDTFYPSWASDGNLYSPWTDGTTDGVKCYSGDSPKRGAITGHAVMIGDDPLKLEIKNTSPPKEAWAKPYRGRHLLAPGAVANNAPDANRHLLADD